MEGKPFYSIRTLGKNKTGSVGRTNFGITFLINETLTSKIQEFY